MQHIDIPTGLHNLCKSRDKTSLLKIKACIEKGLDPNALDEEGYTALTIAAALGHTTNMQLLLDAGAVYEDAGLMIPLESATLNAESRAIEKLLQYPHQIKNLANVLYTANACFHESEKRLSQKYFSISEKITIALLSKLSEKNILWDTSYHKILSFDFKNYLNIKNHILNWINNGGDINSLDERGNTLLYYAVKNKNLNMISFLMNMRIDVNKAGENSHPPLVKAAFNNDEAVLSILLQQPDIDVDQHGSSNMTAIYVAAKYGYINFAKRLLQKNADYKTIGTKDTNGELVTPLGIAVKRGQIHVIKLLLKYPHQRTDLIINLNTSFNAKLMKRDIENRHRYSFISSMIKGQLDRHPRADVLNFKNSKPLNWKESYIELFKQSATEKDIFPRDKKSAIRYALANMYAFMQNPELCIPYLQELSQEMTKYWKNEYAENPPVFDKAMIDLWNYRGHSYPIPNNKYQGVKRNRFIGRVLLMKFKDHDMGNEQYKWTGFLPLKESKTLLLQNAFFTENRRTINGFFHGNMHNVQRWIILCAMEDGMIPLFYQDENNKYQELRAKEVFSALMQKDIFPENVKSQRPLWTTMFDKVRYDYVNFTDPFRLNSMLLTCKEFSGFLQDYLLFGFCEQFIHMRNLFNHVYEEKYTNSDMCDLVLDNLRFHTFGGIPEFAIQVDEKKCLEEVDRIGDLKDSGRRFECTLREKNHYPALKRM